MLKVDPNTNAIQLTRGDTGVFTISLKNPDGTAYTPVSGDKVRFHMARTPGGKLLVDKEIPIASMELTILPKETKELPFGEYWYDIEFTDRTGKVSTVVIGKFELTKEVG